MEGSHDPAVVPLQESLSKTREPSPLQVGCHEMPKNREKGGESSVGGKGTEESSSAEESKKS